MSLSTKSRCSPATMIASDDEDSSATVPRTSWARAVDDADLLPGLHEHPELIERARQLLRVRTGDDEREESGCK